MIRARKLNTEGLALFAGWLESPVGNTPPASLLEGEALTEPFGDYEFDETRKFDTRLEFGTYLNGQFASGDFNELMASASDGFWAWLAVLYFSQLAAKGIRRAEHYVVIRKGSVGSLAYRQAARTSYELVHIHGNNALICLRTPIHTFGDMTEQLASRQTIAHNRAYFQTASDLYISNGKLRSGASSKPKKPKDRKPGDKTGMGGMRRLAIALQRLDLTYDTGDMESDLMKAVLPGEFRKFIEAN